MAAEANRAGTIAVLNPATEEMIGTVAHADRADLDEALEAAARRVQGLAGGSSVRALQDHAPGRRHHRARAMTRSRVLMTMEQGKTLAEAKMEAHGRPPTSSSGSPRKPSRAYGRVIPARGRGHLPDSSVKEPVGPVAAFTPWNFPINQVVRKLSAGACRPAARSSSRRPRKRRRRLRN